MCKLSPCDTCTKETMSDCYECVGETYEKKVGIKFGKEKIQPSLIEPGFIQEMAKGLTDPIISGKYPANNWKKNSKADYIDPLLRHVLEYQKGNLLDDDGNSHLAAIANNAMFLWWFELQGGE